MEWKTMSDQLKPVVTIAAMEAVALIMERTASEIRKEITKVKCSNLKTPFKKQYEPTMPAPNGSSVSGLHSVVTEKGPVVTAKTDGVVTDVEDSTNE